MKRHISIILDRSGSMSSVQSATEEGLRGFIAEQRNTPGDTTVSLYQFDNEYDIVYEHQPLSDIPEFHLHPRGSTALLDAVGKTIHRMREHFTQLPEVAQPDEVIVVILTDGQENDSWTYTPGRIMRRITHQQDEHGWRFVFLGADQEAFSAAAAIGIGRESTLSYSGDRTQETLTRAGVMVSRGTRTGSFSFTQDDRDTTTTRESR
ncbi:vWA domain-containing protein [Sphaerisporangium flaviroseum]